MIIVFTNGCFDIIHPGHIDLLRRAKEFGDYLIVGLNSDNSVKNIKRSPINNQNDRKLVLEAIRYVDEVILFDKETPYELIQKLRPDILIKGGDWSIDKIIGRDLVKETYNLPLLKDYSTTKIIKEIQNRKG